MDSLGLQLTSLTPEFGSARLEQVWVNPAAGGDTIQVTFYQNGVKARLPNREARARYGQVLDLGILRFTVTEVPDVPSATLYIAPREVASDGLLKNLLVAPRAGTDVIDISYTSGNPRRAQRVVNTAVNTFKQLSIQNAKEKSIRRRQFLEAQLRQTDSMLARAQAELASFRSRQQLASTQDALNAQQTSMMALDARRTELEADRTTFTALMAQLRRAGSPGSPRPPRLGFVAGHGREPDGQQLLPSARALSVPARLHDHGALACRSDEPRPDPAQEPHRSTKGQLRQAVSSHVSTMDARIAALKNLRAQTGSSCGSCRPWPKRKRG